MINWFRQRAYSLSAALAHLRRSSASFLLNMLVIALTLSLPFFGATLQDNLKPVAAQLEVNAEISIFMKIDTRREVSSALSASISKVFENYGHTVTVSFVPRESALESMKARGGLADAVAALGANPLPDGFLVRLEQGSGAISSQIDAIAEQLRKLPNIDKVQLDFAWVKRLAALMHALNLMLLFMAAALAIVVIAVAFNTIRLQVMSHLDEIALMRLVGATDAFIRRPFYYTGALLGLGAGGIALGVVALMLLPMNIALADLARLYASELQLTPLPVEQCALLLALSALLGWMGAALSVRHKLSRVG